MNSYTAKLVRKQDVAVGTTAFFFEKPSDFIYKAGQYCEWKLNEIEHAFSLTSAPHEENLMLTTRMRHSEFKNALRNLPLGGQIQFRGPIGSFTLTSLPSVVFLAGGIGITPFRSMILDATHNNLPYKISLFYSNRTPKDAAFLEELQNVQGPNFKFIPTMTQDEAWRGEKGYINKEMLQRHLTETEIAEATFMIAGPAAMNLSLKQMLEDGGIDKTHIRTEEFTGY